MNGVSTTYMFDTDVSLREVKRTLRLALIAVESLYGENRLRLETKTQFDSPNRRCVIDTSTKVGKTLSLVFGGFVRREFGPDAVSWVHASALPGEVHTGEIAC